MELNAYFKSIIEQDREHVVICDLNHTILYMNPSAIRDYAKYGGASLLGRNLMLCHNPNSVAAIQKVVDWFAADKSHNLIFTHYDAKQTGMSIWWPCGLTTAPSSATTRSTSPARGRP